MADHRELTTDQDPGGVSHVSSPAERTRRYTALADMMANRGFDALVVAGRGDAITRGRIQYVSDIFQAVGWGFVVITKDQEPVFIADPVFGLSRLLLVDWIRESRATHTPGEEIAAVVRDIGIKGPRIGIVGLSGVVSHEHFVGLRRALPEAHLEDATDEFDAIKSVKSAEEIAHLEATASLTREAFAELAEWIRPGMTERSITAKAHHLCRQAGVLDGIAQINCTPFDAYSFGTDRIVGVDDVIEMDLEWAGPSGYWVEVRRVFSFKPPTDIQRRFWESRLEAFEACVRALKPGADSRDVLAARDRVYEKHGQSADGALSYSIHGIGLDAVEPPTAPGLDRELVENMVISVHPAIRFQNPHEEKELGAIGVSDNVLVSQEPRRLTDQTDEWVVVGA